MDKKHLRELLKAVKDSYGDFVSYVMIFMEYHGTQESYDKLIQALESSPDITTDDILEMTKDIYKPEVEIYES
jgi:Ni,Fe-hydrogenase maturation factor